MKTPAEELGEALAKDLGALSDKAQADVAKELEVSQQTVSNWMTGKHLPRPAKLVKLHGVFGSDTNTGKVLEHIAPHIFVSYNYDNMIEAAEFQNSLSQALGVHRADPRYATIRAQLGAGKTRSHMPKLGEMTGKSHPTSQPPPIDTDDLPTRMNEEQIPYGIRSFEEHHSVGEMHEALSRAAKGVDLARQVLDDASLQLARAMQQLQKA